MEVLIHCGFCDNKFHNYNKLEYIANPGTFANCCPNCGICDYEKGADFKKLPFPQKGESWINVTIKEW